MAVNVKLKRSHTHSTIPTTSDLAEGEFAVNTYDRKLYIMEVGLVTSIKSMVFFHLTYI